MKNSPNLFGESEISAVVYMLQYREDPIYKIGFSSQLQKRLNRINSILPYRATYIHQISTDSPREIEKHWHRHFATKRRPGSSILRPSEWFDLSSEDVDEFKSYPEMNKLDLQMSLNFDAIEAETKNENSNISRSSAISRVIKHYDGLARSHPDLLVKLANSCNYQIQVLNENIIRSQARNISEAKAIENWEQAAYLAANAKIKKLG